jgi:hypothetical protein
MPRVLSDDALDRLREYPGWSQNAPEHHAIALVTANESARLREHAQEVRDGLIPLHANELTLPLWETMLRLPVNPEGQSIEQRRARVLSQLLATPPDPAGSSWEDRITTLIGPGWSYEEEEGPGEEQQRLRVRVAASPGSVAFAFARRVIERERPAAWELIIESEEGFTLDLSELDLEPFGS